jgi:hypothetical protein
MLLENACALVDILETLTASDPGNVHWQHLLSVNFSRMGQVR